MILNALTDALAPLLQALFASWSRDSLAVLGIALTMWGGIGTVMTLLSLALHLGPNPPNPPSIDPWA